MSTPQWTLTVPVTKSDRDGLFIMGVAAGTGVDAQFDRITPEAIARFSNQLEDNPIPFTNFHIDDDITAELGEVKKAWITESGELGVEIELDEDNEDAKYLYKKIAKGKQYGLSIHGNATNYTYEIDPASAKRVRVLNEVTLDAIGITTRPAYTPSFGTVVRKSIEDAEGETTLSEKELPVEEVAPETPVVPDVPVPDAETSTPEVPEAPVDETPDDVEKSVTTETKAEAKKLAKFVASMTKMMEQAESLGLLSADETPASPDATDTPVVEHSTAIEALTAEVSKSQTEITELRALVDSLREQIPSTELPPAQVSKSDSDSLAKLMAEMSPMERVRFGLALKER